MIMWRSPLVGNDFGVAYWAGGQLGHEKNPPIRICWEVLTSGSAL